MHDLHVRRIHAKCDATTMIELHSLCNLPDKLLVNPTMRVGVSGLTAHIEPRIRETVLSTRRHRS